MSPLEWCRSGLWPRVIADTVREAVENVAVTLERQFPVVPTLLRDAREEITAFGQPPWEDVLKLLDRCSDEEIAAVGAIDLRPLAR